MGKVIRPPVGDIYPQILVEEIKEEKKEDKYKCSASNKNIHRVLQLMY